MARDIRGAICPREDLRPLVFALNFTRIVNESLKFPNESTSIDIIGEVCVRLDRVP